MTPQSPRFSVPFLTAVVLIVLAILNCPPAQALPRYTAVYGQSCVLCHVNPTGGGMRSSYATQFIVPEELAAPRGPDENGLPDFDPELSPFVVVGADLRTLVYQREGGTGSVFSMQGDLYLDVRLSSELSAYLEQSQNGGGEVFGQMRGLPLDGYLKAGRFYPDHGWRFADHQMLTRRFLRDPEGSDDPRQLMGQGIELGLSPGRLTFSAAVLDGQPQLGDSYTARLLVQQGVGPLNLGVGGSVLRMSAAAERRRAAGGIWYLNLGPLTWLGEVDETRQQGRLGNLAAHEITLRLQRGLDLRATYGFQDPDRAEQSGARHRYGVGLAYLPSPHLGVQAMGHRWRIDQGLLAMDADRYEAELLLHVFY